MSFGFVTAVEPKGDRAALLVMDNGVRIWTPDKAKAQELLGKPIPADWTQKQGEYGPQAFPPREGKPGGGKPAWANTEEGERFVQERMDRRTALMQAVIVSGQIGHEPGMGLANTYYQWLRKNLDVSAPRLAAPVGRQAAPVAGEGPEQLPEPTSQVGADTPSDGGDGTTYPRGTESGTVLPSPSSPTHAAKWTPAACEHQLVPGRPGWLKCTRCGSAKKEAEWA